MFTFTYNYFEISMLLSSTKSSQNKTAKLFNFSNKIIFINSGLQTKVCQLLYSPNGILYPLSPVLRKHRKM